MAGLNLPTDIDVQHFSGQFILTAEEKTAPAGWSIHKYGQWQLFTSGLPVLNVYDQTRRWLGWCVGHLIINGAVDPEEVVFHTSITDYDITSLDDFYQRAAGRWALILLQPGSGKIFLDPYGSLSTVFSTIEKTATSTSSLLGPRYDWNYELINAVQLPEKDTWLPCGLTTRKYVQRLLPNHYLNLEDWKVSRHWPTKHTDLSVNRDTMGAVLNIVENIRRSIEALAQKYPLCFSITAGRDSRMLIACARNYLDASSFFTFEEEKESLDMIIARLLANQFMLDHKFLPTQKASAEELNHWLLLTGLSTSGAIWKIHKTLEKLDSNRVLLPGMGGEVGRAYYWRSADHEGTTINAQDVLTRCKLPRHPTLLKATEAWLSELQFLHAFSLLDMVYIEQRLGCWAAPVHYGNTTSAFELTLFNSRQIFHSMLRLPYEYRRKQQLPIDICKVAWPELLQLPFNEYIGVKGYFHSGAKRIKNIVKQMVGR